MAESVSADYPGCSRIEGGSISWPVGRQAGRISFTCKGLDHNPAGTGTFEVEGSDSDKVQFHNCRVVSVRRNIRGGKPRTDITLMDRRWEWEYGRIDGAYNQRVNRDTIKNPKTPRELATLLLDAMGETGYDVLAFPTTGNPEVYWLASNPAAELDALCSLYGLLIGFTTNNHVKIFTSKQGPALPSLAFTVTSTSSADVRGLPSEFQIVTGPVLWECALALIPVGRELDGEIKPIGALSYEPAMGWGNAWRCEFATLTKDQREQARQDIFRMWRINSVVDGDGASSLNPPGYPLAGEPDVASIEQLVPVGTTSQLDLDSGDEESRRRAYIVGNFDPEQWRADLGATDHDIVIPASVSIDPGGRIVRLSQPATRKLLGVDVAAMLYLVTEVQVLGADGVPITYTRTRTNADPNAGNLPLVQRREQLQVRHSATITGDASSLTVAAGFTNITDIDDECDFYLDRLEDEHQTADAGDVMAYGIHEVSHAGNRHEISYSWGNSAPTTRIGVNTRVRPGGLPYDRLQAESLSKVRTEKPPEAQADNINRLNVSAIV